MACEIKKRAEQFPRAILRALLGKFPDDSRFGLDALALSDWTA
jgi:hypothetical protein